MKLICHDNDGKKIFEDGDNWIWINPLFEKNPAYGGKETSTPKNKSPLFPFFAVTRWRYTIDDKETFEKLKKKYEESLVF